MTNILLTGAGFTRNWGGWLANEAFEYVLGRPEVSDQLRARLWAGKTAKHQGFEETLADIQQEQARGTAGAADMLSGFMAALVAMFNEMNQGLYAAQFEPQQSVALQLATFLAKFDFIFTLNQDLFLEWHYFNDNIGLQTPRKFSGWTLPGTKRLHPPSQVFDPRQRNVEMLMPDLDNLTVAPGCQPYFKLHGSSNWMTGTSGDRLLVLGGGKSIAINRDPLLSWYQSQFASALSRPDAKLMVIGYSFADQHINAAITAAADQGGLKIFIVDPEGADVLDKWKGRAGIRPPQPLEEKLSAHLWGASRRSLRSTFGDDGVEHGKLTRFLSL